VVIEGHWWLFGGHWWSFGGWLVVGWLVFDKRRILDENSMNFNLNVNFSNFYTFTNGNTSCVTIHPIKVLVF